jgi:hypothetical protein
MEPVVSQEKQATPPTAAVKATPAKKAVAKKTVAAPVKKAAVARPAKPAKAAVEAVLAKPVKAEKVEKAAKPVKPPKAAKPAKAEKPEKLVRDSFTIPRPEYTQLQDLKTRAATLGKPAKKSEVLRAGIQALKALDDAALLAVLAQVPVIKTGRPSRD